MNGKNGIFTSQNEVATARSTTPNENKLLKQHRLLYMKKTPGIAAAMATALNNHIYDDLSVEGGNQLYQQGLVSEGTLANPVKQPPANQIILSRDELANHEDPTADWPEHSLSFTPVSLPFNSAASSVRDLTSFSQYGPRLISNSPKSPSNRKRPDAAFLWISKHYSSTATSTTGISKNFSEWPATSSTAVDVLRAPSGAFGKQSFSRFDESVTFNSPSLPFTSNSEFYLPPSKQGNSDTTVSYQHQHTSLSRGSESDENLDSHPGSKNYVTLTSTSPEVTSSTLPPSTGGEHTQLATMSSPWRQAQTNLQHRTNGHGHQPPYCLKQQQKHQQQGHSNKLMPTTKTVTDVAASVSSRSSSLSWLPTFCESTTGLQRLKAPEINSIVRGTAAIATTQRRLSVQQLSPATVDTSSNGSSAGGSGDGWPMTSSSLSAEATSTSSVTSLTLPQPYTSLATCATTYDDVTTRKTLNTSLTDTAAPSEVYCCHMCTFVAHMCTHFEHPCPHCDYTSRTEGRLKKHIKDFHSDDNDGHHREPTRPKILRCRQCDFSSADKLDFWQHAREHIKMDKALHCPSCPFVTEYKHHLEYHLRNHFGSKPYQCPKCNYACVNKSMLNSHMKSHTNVYQYRCMDCSYATKYSHSLKLHLQKYVHRPAVVLKPDGSLPIDGSSIFESAAKRSPPKSSPKRRKRRVGKTPHSASGSGRNRSQPTVTVSGVPILVATTPTIMLSHSAGDAGVVQPIVPLTLPNQQLSSHHVTTQQQLDQDNGDLFDEVQPPIIKPATSAKRNGDQCDGTDRLLHSKSLPAVLTENEKAVDMCPILTLNKTFVSSGAEKPMDLTKRVDDMEYTFDRVDEETENKNKKTFQSEPIKLQQQCRVLNNMLTTALQEVTSTTEESRFSFSETINLPHATTCRISLENDNSNNQLLTAQHQVELSTIVDATLDINRENLYKQQRNPPREDDSNPNDTDVKYECSHCQIEFRDYVMYMMHKGYHGYQDPFTCNMCGFHADCRLEFFLHIARVAHE